MCRCPTHREWERKICVKYHTLPTLVFFFFLEVLLRLGSNDHQHHHVPTGAILCITSGPQGCRRTRCFGRCKCCERAVLIPSGEWNSTSIVPVQYRCINPAFVTHDMKLVCVQDHTPTTLDICFEPSCWYYLPLLHLWESTMAHNFKYCTRVLPYLLSSLLNHVSFKPASIHSLQSGSKRIKRRYF